MLLQMKEILLGGKNVSDNNALVVSKCIDQADDLLLEEFDFSEDGIALLANKIAARQKPVG